MQGSKCAYVHAWYECTCVVGMCALVCIYACMYVCMYALVSFTLHT